MEATTQTNTESQATMYTNYRVAVNWVGGSLILCNNIVEIDETIWDNFLTNIYDEDGDEYTEIYQWYLTSWSQSEVEYLMETFPDLLVTYSEKLDLYVLCVDHFGTMWDYVSTETTKKFAVRELGESK